MPTFECEVETFGGARRNFTVEADDRSEAENEIDHRMSRYCTDYEIVFLNEVG